MSVPTGITRVTCTVGTFSSIEAAADLGATVTITASATGLVWAATGQAMFSDPMVVEVGVGAGISFPLIPTDLDGWMVGGLPVDVTEGKQTHTYNVTIQPTAEVAPGKVRKVGPAWSYRNLVVPNGSDTLDLDKAVSVTGAVGGTVAVPDLVGRLEGAVESAAVRAEYAAAEARQIADLDNLDDGMAYEILRPGSASGGAIAASEAASAAKLAERTGARLMAEAVARLSQPTQVVDAVPIPVATSSLETSLGASTLTASGDLITTPAAHGLTIGDRVRLADRTGGNGVNGNTYYVRTVPSDTTFTMFATNGTSGGTADITSDGTATVYKNVPVSEPPYDRVNGRLNPAMVFTDGKPVQAGLPNPTNPRWDMVEPDPATINYGTGTRVGSRLTMHFIVPDADRIELTFLNTGSGWWRVYFDDVLHQTVAASTLGVAAGLQANKLYTFPDNRSRRVSIETNGVPLPIVKRPAKALPLRRPNDMLVGATWADHGTSHIEGGSDPDDVGMSGWTKRALAIRDFRKLGSGGTGIDNPGTGGRVAFFDRYQTDLIAPAPDFAIIGFPENDNPPLVPAVTVNHLRTIVLARKAAKPTGITILHGPIWTRGYEYLTTHERERADLVRALAVELDLPFIDPVGERWITGNGSTGAPNGTGNADFYAGGANGNDPAHFTAAGHRYMGMRRAGAIAALLGINA